MTHYQHKIKPTVKKVFHQQSFILVLYNARILYIILLVTYEDQLI